MLNIEISYCDLKHNLDVIYSRIPKEKLIAILKDNAYGHGIKKICKWLSSLGVSIFGVATLIEAIDIRVTFPQSTIIILKELSAQDVETAIENDFILTVTSIEYLNLVNDCCAYIGKHCKVHIKFDTGLKRWGFTFDKKIIRQIVEIHQMGNLIYDGIFTQMQNTYNMKGNREQELIFEKILQEFKKHSIVFPRVHLKSTYSLNERINKDCFYRIGAGIYGIPNSKDNILKKLKPIMKISTSIVQEKMINNDETIGYNESVKIKQSMHIGILSVGYAHGVRKSTVILYNEKPIQIMCVFLDTTIINLDKFPPGCKGDTVKIDLYEYGENFRIPSQVTCDMGNSICNSLY